MIRQPSNIDSGLQAIGSIVPLPGGTFGLVRVSGNPNTKVEQLRDLETGYRAQINRQLSLDVTGFLSFYKHLQTTEPQTPFFTLSPGPPHLVIPFIFDYKAHARDYGAEAFANWNVTKRWRISPGLTMLNMSVSRDPSSQDATIQQQPGYSPKRSYQVRSFINLGGRFEWDQTAGYTSRLAAGIPGYVRLDTRIGRRIGEFWELSIAGQNLLTPRHAEFPDSQLIDHMLDQRSIFAKITVRF
jgi:iron complex outermembrane recepter protein